MNSTSRDEEQQALSDLICKRLQIAPDAPVKGNRPKHPYNKSPRPVNLTDKFDKANIPTFLKDDSPLKCPRAPYKLPRQFPLTPGFEVDDVVYKAMDLMDAVMDLNRALGTGGNFYTCLVCNKTYHSTTSRVQEPLCTACVDFMDNEY